MILSVHKKSPYHLNGNQTPSMVTAATKKRLEWESNAFNGYR
jgi:hypothetical protein